MPLRIEITASRMPDFLWLGTAWRIDYESLFRSIWNSGPAVR